jgi:hypothetical protein
MDRIRSKIQLYLRHPIADLIIDAMQPIIFTGSGGGGGKAGFKHLGKEMCRKLFVHFILHSPNLWHQYPGVKATLFNL